MDVQQYHNDIKKIILCNCHVGLKCCSVFMKTYIWKKRQDGFFVFDIAKILKKIKLAARAFVAVNKEEIVVISCSDENATALLKFSEYTGCQSSIGRWISGRLTNQACKKFFQPRLVVVADSCVDFQSITEASRVNIPIIAFCNTDSSLKFVDIAIPGNTKDRYSVAFLWWLFAREILLLIGGINPHQDQWVCLDSFLNKDVKKI